MKIALYLLTVSLFLALTASAGPLAVGDAMPRYNLQDQHGNACSLQAETRWVLLSFSMSHSKKLHQWLTERPTFFSDRKTEYVADISPMPAIINTLFAGPKMRRYPFPIIQATEDDFAESYPVQEDAYLLIELDEQQRVAAFHYPTSVEDVVRLVEPEEADAYFQATQ